MYFSQVRIDPNDPDRLLIANVQVMLSTDGGKTFANADATIHDDIHAIWWDPKDSNHIMIGTDGGVGISWDYTKTWHFLPNLPIGLFYHVSVDNATPYNICGGMQDNYAWCGPSAVRNQRGISNERWSRLQIGDGMTVIPDPVDSRIVYSSTQDGSVTRKNKITGESKSVRPQAKPGEPALRWNWDTPMVFSPIDHALLVAAQTRLPIDGPRRLVDGDQPRPHDEREPRRPDDHGREGQRRPLLQKRRHRRVADDRHGRGVGEAGRRVLRRHGRRRRERVEGRRQDVGQDARRADAGLSEGRVGVGGRAVAVRRGHRVRHRRRAPVERLSTRTSG